MRGFGIAGLALAATICAAAGQEMKSPHISSTHADWGAAVLELAPFDALKPAVLSNGVRTMVPPFVGTGTKIVVMTADGSYVERAKD